MVTISSEPTFTGPGKSDSTKRRTPSRHSSMYRKDRVCNARPAPRLKHVQVDGCRVVHYRGVVLAGEDVPGSAHIGCQLIDFVYALDYLADYGRVAQVADDEFVS
jgi:hypothetical protein